MLEFILFYGVGLCLLIHTKNSFFDYVSNPGLWPAMPGVSFSAVLNLLNPFDV